MRAYTLIETLVVMAVIAVLVALALPAMAQARNAASDSGCRANLRSTAQAINVFRADNKGQLPSGWEDMDIGMPICPIHRQPGSYTLSSFGLIIGQPRLNWSAVVDTVPAGKVIVAVDSEARHPWRNAGWLDGRAGKL